MLETARVEVRFLRDASSSRIEKSGPGQGPPKAQSVLGGDKQERSVSKPSNVVNGFFQQNLTGDPNKKRERWPQRVETTVQ
jgi:hypothetical protein